MSLEKFGFKKINKELLMRVGYSNLNEYKNCDWFEKKHCQVRNVLEKVQPFHDTQTQWHVGFKGKTGYVIIRGSDESADWWGPTGNFNFWKAHFGNGDDKKMIPITTKVKTDARVSLGWKRGYKLIKKNLFKIIKQNPDINNWVFSGHSRGAPMAAYAAQNVAFYYPKKKVYGVYLSSPRPGNRAFQKLHDSCVKESIMLYIIGDLVCCVPPYLAGYRALGKTHGFLYPTWPPICGPHYPSAVVEAMKGKL